MTVEIEGTVAKVAVGYSLKVPGAADYSSEDAHCSYSIEYEIGGKTVDEINDISEAIEAQLHTNAKLAVFAQLGIEFEAGESGVITPILKSRPKAAKPQARSNGGQRSGGGGGGGNYPPKTPAKAAGRQLEVVTLGGVDYYDQRPLKEDNTYKPGAADFKSVESTGVNAGGYPNFKQLWIYDQQGEPQSNVTDLLDEAGIDY